MVFKNWSLNSPTFGEFGLSCGNCRQDMDACVSVCAFDVNCWQCNYPRLGRVSAVGYLPALHQCGTCSLLIYGCVTVLNSLNGCSRPICLVFGTAALCGDKAPRSQTPNRWVLSNRLNCSRLSHSRRWVRDFTDRDVFESVFMWRVQGRASGRLHRCAGRQLQCSRGERWRCSERRASNARLTTEAVRWGTCPSDQCLNERRLVDEFVRFWRKNVRGRHSKMAIIRVGEFMCLV